MQEWWRDGGVVMRQRGAMSASTGTDGTDDATMSASWTLLRVQCW